MVEDLVSWLSKQVNEDERIARAACWDDQSDVWTARPPQARYEQFTVEDYLGDGVVVVAPENADDDGVGQHVAEWDPARVLREVDAKRQLIALHTEGSSDLFCAHCEHEPPCPTLRLLALPYADRPGYREEWRP